MGFENLYRVFYNTSRALSGSQGQRLHCPLHETNPCAPPSHLIWWGQYGQWGLGTGGFAHTFITNGLSYKLIWPPLAHYQPRCHSLKLFLAHRLWSRLSDYSPCQSLNSFEAWHSLSKMTSHSWSCPGQSNLSTLIAFSSNVWIWPIDALDLNGEVKIAAGEDSNRWFNNCSKS